MEKQTPLEIKTSRLLGYNLGIKFIRGAYMNEERRVAKTKGSESPIQETIEDTHRNYNTNLKLIIQNLGPKDKLFIGTHNVDSINFAK